MITFAGFVRSPTSYMDSYKAIAELPVAASWVGQTYGRLEQECGIRIGYVTRFGQGLLTKLALAHGLLKHRRIVRRRHFSIADLRPALQPPNGAITTLPSGLLYQYIQYVI